MKVLKENKDSKLTFKVERFDRNVEPLDEEVLEETVVLGTNVLGNMLNQFQINGNTLPKSDRGNGALRETLCSIVFKVWGLAISPSDYVVHHIDGNHNNYAIDNLALVKIGGGWTHKGIHTEALQSAIKRLFGGDKHFANGSVVAVPNIQALTFKEIDQVFDYYIQNIASGTVRRSKFSGVNKRGRTSTLTDIIIMSQVL